MFQRKFNSIFSYPEDGDSSFTWNTGNNLPNYIMSHTGKAFNILARRTANLTHFYNFINIVIKYFSTFQSDIILPSSVLLALILPKQNFILVSSIPKYLPIQSHYITTQWILIPNCRLSCDNSRSMVNLTRIMGKYFWKGIVWKSFPLCRCIRFVTEMIGTESVWCVEDIHTFL